MDGDMDFKAKSTSVLENMSRKFEELCTEAVETMEFLGNQFQTAQTSVENFYSDFAEQMIPLISPHSDNDFDLFTHQTSNAHSHANFPSEALTNDESLVKNPPKSISYPVPSDSIDETFGVELSNEEKDNDHFSFLKKLEDSSSYDSSVDGESVRSDDFFSVVSDYGSSNEEETKEEVSSSEGETEEEEVSAAERETEVEEVSSDDGETKEVEKVISDERETEVEEVSSDDGETEEEEVSSEDDGETEEEEVGSDDDVETEEEEVGSDDGESEDVETKDDSSCVTKQDMKVIESFGKDFDNQETMKVSGNQFEKAQMLERLEVMKLCAGVHSGISRSQFPPHSLWFSESLPEALNDSSVDARVDDESVKSDDLSSNANYGISNDCSKRECEPDMEALIKAFGKEIIEYLFEEATEPDIVEISILKRLEGAISYAEGLHSSISKFRFPHGYCFSESLLEASHGRSYNKDLIREALEAEDLIIHEASEAKIPLYQKAMGVLGNQLQMQTSLRNLCPGDVEQAVPLINFNPIIQQTRYSDYLTSDENSPSEAEVTFRDELFDYTPLEQSDDTELEPEATTGELLERTLSPPETPGSNEEDDDQFSPQTSMLIRLQEFISSYQGSGARSDIEELTQASEEKEVNQCTVMHEDTESEAKIAPYQEHELETFEVVDAEEVKSLDERDLSDSEWEII